MTSSVVEANLLRLKKNIAPYTPRIIAVTKYYDTDAIISAYNAGIRDFGESRAIDAIKKIESLPEEIRKDSKFHFIGHLQTNKAERVIKYFDYIHSTDSLHLAQVISDCAVKLEKKQKILFQVNISGEVQKFGFEENELKNCMGELMSLKGIKPEGLMCMAPLGASERESSEIFLKNKVLLNVLNELHGLNLNELSMGMSDDYVSAVKNGATMVRIGRLLFE